MNSNEVGSVEAARDRLNGWRERARTNQKAHYDEAERHRRFHFWFGVFAIVISAGVLTTAAMVFTLVKFWGEDLTRLLLGFLGLLAAVASAIQTFSKFSEWSAEYHAAARKYGIINRNIEKHLALPLPSGDQLRALLDDIETQMNTAALAVPAIPRARWSKVPDEVTPKHP